MVKDCSPGDSSMPLNFTPTAAFADLQTAYERKDLPRMKKPKSTRGKASTSAETPAPPAADDKPTPQAPEDPISALQGACSQANTRGAFLDDIPEDALPPQRPDPILSLRLSAALHLKLRNQAQEEGIGLEALVQEMLAESVVLRAWEIVERKNAMRGAGPGTHQNQSPSHNNRNSYGSSPGNGNTKQARPAHGNHSGQGSYGNPGRQGGYQSQQGRPPNNAWMEDKAAFLEYVRNQEKRGRR